MPSRGGGETRGDDDDSTTTRQRGSEIIIKRSEPLISRHSPLPEVERGRIFALSLGEGIRKGESLHRRPRKERIGKGWLYIVDETTTRRKIAAKTARWRDRGCRDWEPRSHDGNIWISVKGESEMEGKRRERRDQQWESVMVPGLITSKSIIINLIAR